MALTHQSNTFAQRRSAMVDSQLRTSQVKQERLLDAMESLPREAFLPEALAGVAYIDEDLALDAGHILMEPRVLARLLEAAQPKATDMALVVGAGTGYEAALLDQLVSTVTLVSSAPAVESLNRDLLSELGTQTLETRAGGIEALAELDTDFDLILVVGALRGEVPESVSAKLNEGGRLVAVVADSVQAPGHAVLINRSETGLSEALLFEAHTPFLPGQVEKTPGFIF